MQHSKTATNLIAALILALAVMFTCPLAVQAQVELCETNEECDDAVFCNGEELCVWSDNEEASICIAGTDPCEEGEDCLEETEECVSDAECETDDDCADELFCNGDETCDGGECAPGTDPCEDDEFCDEGLEQCLFEPECETDDDCAIGQICTVSGKICINDPDCVLNIKHKKIRAKKLTKPRKFKLRISASDDNWNRLGSRDLGPLTSIRFSPDPHRNKKRMKLKVEVPAGLEPGFIPIRIGDCYGEIEIIE
jgi:hypothetical protein